MTIRTPALFAVIGYNTDYRIILAEPHTGDLAQAVDAYNKAQTLPDVTGADLVAFPASALGPFRAETVELFTKHINGLVGCDSERFASVRAALNGSVLEEFYRS